MRMWQTYNFPHDVTSLDLYDMKNRLLATFLVLAFVMLAMFWGWGESIENLFIGSTSGRGDGDSGLPGIVVAAFLLALDPFLPVPVTMVITWLGISYGFWAGGLIAVAGTFSAGLLAYATGRFLPADTKEFLLGEDGGGKAHIILERYGGWLVAFSRWMAILPEILGILAGMGKMPFRKYVLALLCGLVPMSFAYSWLGASRLAEVYPLLGLLLSALPPLLLWAILGRRWQGLGKP